jgi:hypothetical protein
MWSGPRNLSTAMMYAFGARADFAVVDEPFYAAYLDRTGLDHPMRDQIIMSQPTDPNQVAALLTGPIPDDRPHFYQKHMTQHVITGIPRDWFGKVRHVFLIRHPARVVASFGAKYDNPTLADIGFTQQTEIFDDLTVRGIKPLVIDSADIRDDPRGMLIRLCDALGLPFDPAMLLWPKGGHPADGIWAPHWYGAVHASTGFAPAEGPLPNLQGAAAALVEQALPHYQQLEALKL